MTCARCGSRYEGHSQYRKRVDENGKRLRTLGYACGGYIRHGRSVCQIGRIKKDPLEHAIIDAVVAHYSCFIGEGAREHIADALEEHVGNDVSQIAETQLKLKARIRKVDSKGRGLLDNLSEANRLMANARLSELSDERNQLDEQLESLEHMAITEEESQVMTTELIEFMASLRSSLDGGPLDRRQATIRRCVDGIMIDLDGRLVRVAIRRLPAINGGSYNPATTTVEIPVPCAR